MSAPTAKTRKPITGKGYAGGADRHSQGSSRHRHPSMTLSEFIKIIPKDDLNKHP
jgi:hypothetical protein